MHSNQCRKMGRPPALDLPDGDTLKGEKGKAGFCWQGTNRRCHNTALPDPLSVYV